MALPGPGPALERTLFRLSGLFSEASQLLAEMAENVDIQLAAGQEASLMDPVEPAPEKPSPGTELMTVGDLGARVKVNERTIRRWRSEGKLPPAIEFGGVLRWRPEVIEQWIAEREEAR